MSTSGILVYNSKEGKRREREQRKIKIRQWVDDR